MTTETLQQLGERVALAIGWMKTGAVDVTAGHPYEEPVQEGHYCGVFHACPSNPAEYARLCAEFKIDLRWFAGDVAASCGLINIRCEYYNNTPAGRLEAATRVVLLTVLEIKKAEKP